LYEWWNYGRKCKCANINKQKSIKWKKRINEDKSLKYTCTKKNLTTTLKIILCWSFSCINDNTKINLENTQIMCCSLCYQELVIGINSRTQARKGLIFYYKTNGITFLKKTCGCRAHYHCKIVWRKKNSLLKGKEEKQPVKKIAIMSWGSIFNFFL
jgi:hypothetical protein